MFTPVLFIKSARLNVNVEASGNVAVKRLWIFHKLDVQFKKKFHNSSGSIR